MYRKVLIALHLHTRITYVESLAWDHFILIYMTLRNIVKRCSKIVKSSRELGLDSLVSCPNNFDQSSRSLVRGITFDGFWIFDRRASKDRPEIADHRQRRGSATLALLGIFGMRRPPVGLAGCRKTAEISIVSGSLPSSRCCLPT